MAAITANTGAQTWNTNAAWVGGVQPTAADDVTIPASATVTIPTATTALGRSCTVQASGALAFATTTAQLTLGDATAGAGNVAFSNAGTITLTAIGIINFISTSATQQTIDSGGQTLPSLVFNSASNGSYSLLTGLTIGTTATLTLTKGTLTTNAQTCSWGLLSSNNSNVRSLDITNSTITISGTGTVWDMSVITNLTFTSTGSTVNCTGAAPVVRGQGSTAQIGFNNLSYTAVSGSSSCVYLTANNLTITNTAAKAALVSWTEVTVATLLTCNANSKINRIVWTSAHGVTGAGQPAQAIITAASVSLSNLDMTDINGAGAATWTGTSMGDGGNNTGITFDAPATQTWNGNTTANWSIVGNWTSRIPLPQDDVIINGLTSGTLTADMPRMGKSINLTGSTGGTLSLTSAVVTLYGSLTLVSGVALAQTQAITFAGRGSYTLTMAGKSFLSNVTLAAPTGTLALQDNLTTTGTLFWTSGTLTATTQNVSAVAFSSSNTNARALNMGSGTWTVSGTGGCWTIATPANATINTGTSTIALTNTAAATKTFSGAGVIYNNLTISGAVGGGAVLVSGANFFNVVTAAANAHLTLPSSTVTTINGLVSTGSAGNLFVLDATTAGTAATLKSWNPIATDFISVKDSTASQCIPFYAGANGTLVSGDTNWSAVANPNSTNLGTALSLTGVG